MRLCEMAEKTLVKNDPFSSLVVLQRGLGSFYNLAHFCSFLQMIKGSQLTHDTPRRKRSVRFSSSPAQQFLICFLVIWILTGNDVTPMIPDANLRKWVGSLGSIKTRKGESDLLNRQSNVLAKIDLNNGAFLSGNCQAELFMRLGQYRLSESAKVGR